MDTPCSPLTRVCTCGHHDWARETSERTTSDRLLPAIVSFARAYPMASVPELLAMIAGTSYPTHER